MSVVWRVAEYMKNLDARMGRNLDKIGVFLQGEVVKSFGSPMALPEGGATVGTGAREHKVSGKRFRGMQHSKPGEPPFVQTGTLRRSITWKREGSKVFIGSSLQPQGGSAHSYAWWLEYVVGPRPYLRPAVRNNKAKIMQLFRSR